MRRKYPSILGAFVKLFGLKNVTLEDEAGVAQALQLANGGIDFADALRLSSRPAGAQFVSSDRAFVRRAKSAGVSQAADAVK